MSHKLAWIGCHVLLVACTSAWNDSGPPPYTAAETDRALAPIKPMQVDCYAASQSARDKRSVKLEFMLYVDEQGAVHSEPQLAEPHDPGLIECMRRGLDGLQFPKRGEHDELRLQFQLGP
jgi:hypothetical protein